MAKSLKKSDKLIDESTECLICVKQMCNPRMLPCQHTFCLECLERYFGKKKQPGNKISCPMCMKTHSIPSGKLSELPKNLLIEKMLQTLRKPESDDYHPCGKCLGDTNERGDSERVPAVKFCVECEVNLCESCCKKHQKNRLSKNHTLQTVEYRKKKTSSNFEMVYNRSPDTAKETSRHSNDSQKLDDIIKLLKEVPKMREDFSKLTKEVPKIREEFSSLRKEVPKIREEFSALRGEIPKSAKSAKLEETDAWIRQEITALRKEFPLRQLSKVPYEDTMWYDAIPMKTSEVPKKEKFETPGKEQPTIPTDNLNIANKIEKANKSSSPGNQIVWSEGASVSSVLKKQVQPVRIDKHSIPGKHSKDMDWSEVPSEFPALGTEFESSDRRWAQRNEDDLELVNVIQFERAVHGVTVLDGKMFIVLNASPEIREYESDTLALKSTISMAGLGFDVMNPYDITATNESLYVCDNENSLVVKTKLPGRKVTYWIVGEDMKIKKSLQSLSIAKNSNILVTCLKPAELLEYTQTGNLVRTIQLRKDGSSSFLSTCALHMENDTFLVCHGGCLSQQSHDQRVCLTDNNGRVLKSYGKRRGSATRLLNSPFHLAVDRDGFIMVADFGNNRIALLTTSLEFVKHFTCHSLDLKHPFRLFFDEGRSRLYVSDDSTTELAIFKMVIPNRVAVATLWNDFLEWCKQALVGFDADVDIPALVCLLRDSSSQYEVIDYIRSNFEDSKRVREFAHQLFNRKREIACLHAAIQNLNGGDVRTSDTQIPDLPSGQQYSPPESQRNKAKDKKKKKTAMKINKFSA